eukprot:superscaffoldBa00000654_g6342
MVTSSFISEIKGELVSIEQLISVLLQRQTDLGSRPASLELPVSTSLTLKVNRHDTVDPSPGCSTWASVVKGKKRLSLPLYDSQDDSTELELCNFFTPLAALPQSPSLLLNVDCADGKRKVTPSIISKRGMLRAQGHVSGCHSRLLGAVMGGRDGQPTTAATDPLCW